MAQIDTSSVMLENTMIGENDDICIAVSMRWDGMARSHRVTAWDTTTMNDSSRVVSNGRDAENRVPVRSFIDVLPLMVEEIIILNKLMGPK
jgi:hypothetical protein